MEPTLVIKLTTDPMFNGGDNTPRIPRHEPTIYFDLDGVLANFDKAAEQVLGTNNIYRYEFVHGADVFWYHLNREPNFFRNMELLPGAVSMIQAVWRRPIAILTALPKSKPEVVDQQKRCWVAYHLGTIPVVTCQTHEKPNYCQPGDVLIDDRAVNKKAWEAKGGRYILHTDVGSTIAQLDSMGLTR